MKKYLFLALVLILGVSAFTACSEDDNLVVPADLPQAAQTFMERYFSGTEVLSVKKEGKHSDTEYTVKLRNGYEVEFDATGNWTDVDAPAGKTIPDGIAPNPIANYVAEEYPGMGINEISRDYKGYDVELVTGLDLEFDIEGNFLRVDR
ncbi:MAG: PepSY-like domain-containing protein [Muribaculaceae bacterium]|nr:PepSY-like domain-containing protein [Muribaculaceae bacterium]